MNLKSEKGMDTRTRVVRSKTGGVLMLAKQFRRARELELRLAGYFHKVCRVSDSAAPGSLPPADDVSVIVVTDSFGLKGNKAFIFMLRKKYPLARMVYLADRISKGEEAVIRGVGVVFLGSYERFFNTLTDILQSALEQVEA